jgi:ribonuclease HI
VTTKRLGDITDEEIPLNETFSNKAEMFTELERRYGTASPDLHVKLVSFTFAPYKKPKEPNPQAQPVKSIKLYADGGSRGNPGPSASGYVLLDMDDNVIKKSGVYLGITTNNQAEYQALKFGLEEAQKLGAREVAVYMDSLLVINQMKGLFKVRNRDLWPIHEAIKQQVPLFKKVTFTHVPRELNKLADAEVNTTLDAEENN